MTDLGTMPGDVSSKAVAINDQGQIVGYSEDINTSRSVVWQNGGIWDLNTLISADAAASMSLLAAYGINDRGQILILAIVPNWEFTEPIVATPTAQHWPPHGSRHFVLPDHVRDQIRQHRERGAEHLHE